MPGAVQVVIVLAVVAVGIAVWFGLELLDSRPRRPGYIERSPNGSTKARWRVR